MVKDNPKVYTVAAMYADDFNASIDKLRDKKFVTFEATALNYFKVVPSGARTIEIKANTDSNAQGQEYGVNQFVMVQPFKTARSVDSTKFQDYVTGIPNFVIKDFVEENAKDLAKYGLDKPKVELQVKDANKGEVHIYLGNDKDDSSVYFRIEGSNSIYTIDKESVKTYFTIDPFALADKFAALINIDGVDKVVIQSPTQKNTITFSRQTKKAAKEGDKDEVVTTYKVDDKEIKEDEFKKYYQILIGLIVDSENDKKLEDKPEVTTTFYMNKGSQKEIKVDYVPYNDTFYGVYKNGICEFVISKDKVNNMLKETENIKTK
jgi:hypothetical protein